MLGRYRVIAASGSFARAVAGAFSNTRLLDESLANESLDLTQGGISADSKQRGRFRLGHTTLALDKLVEFVLTRS